MPCFGVCFIISKLYITTHLKPASFHPLAALMWANLISQLAAMCQIIQCLHVGVEQGRMPLRDW